jgi:undecaprenyl-diphosphatase
MSTSQRAAVERGAEPVATPQRSGGGWSLAEAGVTIAVGYLALSAALIVVGLILVHLLAPVRHWDDHVNAWFAAHRTSGWNRVSKAGTFLANTMGVVVVATVVTVFGLLRRWGRMAALLACGLAVELAVFLTVNYIVQRPRPTATHLGPTPSTYSFPSGHVGATFVLYGGIAVLVMSRTARRWARTLAWSVAALAVVWVGLSRVYEAEHHPTDAFAGLCLGIGALVTTVLAIRPAWPSRTSSSSPGRGRDLVVLEQADSDTSPRRDEALLVTGRRGDIR